MSDNSKLTEEMQAQFDALMSMHRYHTKEDFPEELRDFVVTKGPYTPFDMLDHPFGRFIIPTMLQIPIEEYITDKMKRYEDEMEHGNWTEAIMFLERAYRLPYILNNYREGRYDTAKSNPDHAKKYWEMIADWWVDAEFDESDPVWTDVLSVDIPHREFMTSEEDRKKLESMDDTITIYRGVQAEDEEDAEWYADSGWQWTFSFKVAKFFARRLIDRDTNGAYVITAKVPKNKIVAYLTGRSEEEVLIEPGTINVDNATVEEV